ncbi:MAG: PD40 domain-containing protein, partial [Chloroflexi bacterium]|nr:PD40 domain-containing protein [Chloroflexota bacterium]
PRYRVGSDYDQSGAKTLLTSQSFSGGIISRFNQIRTAREELNLYRIIDRVYTIQGLTWSPNGNQLAFTSNPDVFPGYAYLITVNQEGKFGAPKDLWVLNRLDFDNHQYLNWSPRDDRLAFLSRPFGGPESKGGYFNIFVAAIDGSQFAQLSHVRRLPESVVEPVWSPDAEFVAIAVTVPHNGVGIAASDGSKVTWLTEETVREFPPIGFSLSTLRPNLASVAPAWYPDGSAVLFLVTLQGDQPTSLYRVNRDGSGLIRLVDSNVYSPAISPDGTRIAYITFEEPNRRVGKIIIADANARNPKEIVRMERSVLEILNPLLLRDLSWSPDGTRLAFAANPNGNMDLFVVNADGTELRNITGWPGDEIAPRWRPRR